MLPSLNGLNHRQGMGRRAACHRDEPALPVGAHLLQRDTIQSVRVGHMSLAPSIANMVPTRRHYTEADKQRALDMVLVGGRSAAAAAREAGINPGRLRRWLSEKNAQDWAETVDAHFGFLAGHGFTLEGPDASWHWEWTVVYRRGSAVVVVVQDRQGPCVDVRLVRAKRSAPGRRRPFNADEVGGSAWAVKLVWLRAPNPPELLARIAGLGLTHEEIEVQLAFWANVLRTYGADFLAGELSVLDEPDPPVRHHDPPRTAPG